MSQDHTAHTGPGSEWKALGRAAWLAGTGLTPRDPVPSSAERPHHPEGPSP